MFLVSTASSASFLSMRAVPSVPYYGWKRANCQAFDAPAGSPRRHAGDEGVMGRRGDGVSGEPTHAPRVADAFSPLHPVTPSPLHPLRASVPPWRAIIASRKLRRCRRGGCPLL